MPSTPLFKVIYYLFRPGCVDRLHRSIQVFRACNIAGDMLPEGASANFTRHQVGSVEAEAGCSGDELGNAPVQV